MLAIRSCAAMCLFFVSFNEQCCTWRLNKCTCFRVLVFFFKPFSRVSAIIELAGVKGQRTCLKFCFKLNKTAAETHLVLEENFGVQALSHARKFAWFKRFKVGRESVEDDKHSGRPSTCTTPEMIAKVREVILEDRRKTIHYVCNSVGLPYGSSQRIVVDDLSMIRIAARFVLRLLNNDQRDLRVQMCTKLQEAVRHGPNFLSRVINGND